MRTLHMSIYLTVFLIACRAEPAHSKRPGGDAVDEPESEASSPMDASPATSESVADAEVAVRSDDCGESVRLDVLADSASFASISGSVAPHQSPTARGEFDLSTMRMHEVDLSSSAETVRLHALVAGSFDPVIVLGRGSCEDPTAGVRAPPLRDGLGANWWSGEVEPGRYVVAVGALDDEQGEYTLQLVAEELDSACEKADNTSCELAHRLDTTSAVTTEYLAPGCGNESSEGSRYYELDLSGESSRSALYITVNRTDRRGIDTYEFIPLTLSALEDEDEPCGREIAEQTFIEDDSTLSTLVEPGRYLIRAERYEPHSFVLTTRWTRLDCSATTGDTCETAQPVTFETGLASFSDNTHCSTSRLDFEECYYEPEAPDKFYRVDLSEYDTRVRLRGHIRARDLNFHAGLVLLKEGDAGGCGSFLSCYDRLSDGEGYPEFDMILEPAVYIVAVAGVLQGHAGEYVLDLALSEATDKDFAPCYFPDIDNCVFYENSASQPCCENPLGAECSTLFISCGLDPTVADCVCEAQPGCCDGGADDLSECAEALAACNFFCEGYAASDFACLDHEALRMTGQAP